MRGKRSRSLSSIRVIVSYLTVIVIFSLVLCKFQVQPASADVPNSPDNITVTVEGGGELVNDTKTVDSYFGFVSETFYYVTPANNKITVEASTPAMEDLMHLTIAPPNQDYIMENGTNKALSVVATFGFNDSAYVGASVTFDGDHSLGVAKYYHFYARPQITSIKLSSDKITQFETVHITARCLPVVYAQYGTFNFIIEDKDINSTQLARTYDSTFDSALGTKVGTFSMDICPRDFLPDHDPTGDWIITAQLHVRDFGSSLIEPEIPDDLMTTSLENYLRVTSFAPTPTPYVPLYNFWTITKEEGDVEVLLKSKGFASWHPFEEGMKLTPEDSIRTGNSLKDFAILKNSEGAEITLTKGAILKVSDLSSVEVRTEAYAFYGLTLYGGESIYDTLEHPPTTSKLRVQTPDAIITDSGTEFWVLVDEYGTHVRTFSGSVSVTDINSALSVEVSENQTTSVQEGNFPNPPIQFNASAVDRWWDALPSETSTPTGFDLSNVTGFLPFIAVAVIVVIVVVVALVVWSKRNYTKTQVYYPAPPPPPSV